MKQLSSHELLSISGGIQLSEVIPFLSGYNNLSLVNNMFFQAILGGMLGEVYGLQLGFSAIQSLGFSLGATVICAAWAIPEYYVGSLFGSFIDQISKN